MSAVLIVDDDQDNRNYLALRVSLLGHEVLCAGSAMEATLLLADHEVPDAAILDIVMPHVTGLQLVEYWRTNPAYAAMPVIFLTARDLGSDADRARVLGAAYLLKPVVGAVLAQALERALGETSEPFLPAEEGELGDRRQDDQTP